VTEGTSSAIFIGVVIWIALLLPALMIWGWARWFKVPGEKTLSSKLALGGFVFANISVLIGLSALLFAHNTSGSPVLNPWLLRLYSFGLVASVLGVLLSLAGLRRSSPLRWPGLLCAGGILLFWLFTSV
jgi:hypothetical protein